MRIIRHTTIVNTPAKFCLYATNCVERWPEVMIEYRSVRLLRTEGKKIWFELDHENGSTWTSWRRVDEENLFAYAERHSPLDPFKYMQILWTYHPKGDECQMTWEMCFEPVDIATEDVFSKRFEEHSAGNIVLMGAFAEAEFRRAQLAKT